jgi:hypothetical protein
MSIYGIENIKELFCILHDGVIISGELTRSEMRLEVEIPYLAKRIDPSYQNFRVILKGTEDVRFTTWPNELELTPRVLRNIHEIFEPQLDILSGRVRGKHVQMACSQSSPDYDYCGGELCFIAEQASVIDEAGKSYSIGELDTLARGYWDDWANSSQES